MRSLVLLLIIYVGVCQQPFPMEMCYDPENYRFSIGGNGTGNFYDITQFQNDKIASSLQGVFLTNALVIPSAKKQKKFFSLGAIGKYNFLQNNSYNVNDTFRIELLMFPENISMFSTGLYFKWNSEIQNSINYSQFYKCIFADLVYTPFNITNSNYNYQGFTSILLHSGIELGILGNTGVGLVGPRISLYGSYMYIYNKSENDKSLEELLGYNINDNLSRNLLGGGIKISLYFNDIMIYFEGRRFINLEGNNIKELTTRPMFTVGASAIGEIFKDKYKENPVHPR